MSYASSLSNIYYESDFYFLNEGGVDVPYQILVDGYGTVESELPIPIGSILYLERDIDEKIYLEKYLEFKNNGIIKDEKQIIGCALACASEKYPIGLKQINYAVINYGHEGFVANFTVEVI